jgi:multiple sugar transport system permease protein
VKPNVRSVENPRVPVSEYTSGIPASVGPVETIPESVRTKKKAIQFKSEFLEQENILAYVLVAPALIILAVFIAYPFILGVWLSLTDKVVGQEGHFVGLQNFRNILRSQIFVQTILNTFVYTGAATVLKLVFGLALALVLNRHFKFKRFVRASMLLPWIIPTVLSTLAWLWMFDATFSVFNWVLIKLGFIKKGLLWLGAPNLAMTSVILVNAWRGIPFFAISLLAGLQTISPDLYEAAEIDGAGSFAKFWNITLPMLMPVLLVVLIFSVIVTFADFQVVYVLTRGGPSNSTHLFATLAYQVALASGRLGEGAAISLFMFPFLLLIIIIQLRYLRRET